VDNAWEKKATTRKSQLWVFLLCFSFFPFALLLPGAIAFGDAIGVAGQEAAESRGIQLFAKGQLVEAREFFVAFVNGQPKSPVGVFYLGRIAFEEQHYDRAIEWLEKAVQRDSGNSNYHLWLGRAYGHQAEQSAVCIQPFLAKKVKEQFEQAVALDPENLTARADLMEYYLKAPGFLGGSKEKAWQQAEEITRRDVDQGIQAWRMQEILGKN
jgi:tetratricopeptide (TPR) repeat protein